MSSTVPIRRSDQSQAQSASPPTCEFVDVHSGYDGKSVLRGTSFRVPAGQITVMLGPSGIGKTTVVSHAVGLYPPESGSVYVDGEAMWAPDGRGVVHGMRERDLRAWRKRIGVVLEGYAIYGSALFDSMSVLENVRFQLRELTDMPEEAIDERARQRIVEVGMGDFIDEMPYTLSGGERKRVAIARAMASDPDFLVIDSFEPGIDGVRLVKLCELLRRRHAELGGTYLIVTHDMDVARRLADHIVVIADGRTVAEGTADDVFESDEAAVAQLISGSHDGPITMATAPKVVAPGEEDPGPYSLDNPVWVTRAMIGLLALLPILVLYCLFEWAAGAIVIVAVWAVGAAVIAALLRSRRRTP